MATFVAAEYVNSSESVFNWNYNSRDPYHERYLPEAPKLASDLINDGYTSEGCTILNWLQSLPLSFSRAVSLIDDDDDTFVYLKIDEDGPNLISRDTGAGEREDLFRIFKSYETDGYKCMSLTELKRLF